MSHGVSLNGGLPLHEHESVEYAEQLVLEVVDEPSRLPPSVTVPPSPLPHSAAHELSMHAKIAPSVEDSLTSDGTRHE